jgi:hypothetical protein
MWPAAARPASIIAFYTGAFAHLSPMFCRASLKATVEPPFNFAEPCMVDPSRTAGGRMAHFRPVPRR